MPKGVPNKKYTPEFKKLVIETMHKEELSYRETQRRFDLPNNRVQAWERIYLEEGEAGFMVERRGRASAASGTAKGRKPVLDSKIEEDLIEEVQRLRAEVAYLKNLQALVLENEQRQQKKRR